ncbi:binding-protein-dependent transport systems inner membrane component [Haladaptatus paucihalophilus DX253]|uniref:Binding-protein-dependent transport systems inner membrane component n=1 Tax=Haladaptatus paucihalophilus DX253 TaxID=797209 RepID=E7QXX7_HALPU|nr:ABC transporter permease [Haladaptatus paucihalophilus]EFW90678.1 binding-protein-dependent transport systems inner membrane component [Haladaptatus paucihalophilus DX253]SHL55681.1 peptide/nickel transport system permease protein [Haladaptatus paucihalophilus DX253]
MATRNDTFDTIEWSEYTTDSRSIARRTVAFSLVALAVALGFLYDLFFFPDTEPLVFEWNPTPLDWIFTLSLAIFFCYVLVPLAQNRELTRRRWEQLKANPVAVASLGYLVFFFVTGLVAPMFLSPLRDAIVAADGFRYDITPYQPPFGFTVPFYGIGITRCVGQLANNACHGSLIHPLGTTGSGEDLLIEILQGMRVALEVTLISATLIAPLATAVGTVAAYFGGRVDEVLMRYVDLQQAIPPLFVFLLLQALYGGSILLMIAVFGLLSWGSTARLVRSEALQKTELGFVRAAKGAGSGHLRVIRDHLLPNVSSTVLVSVTLQIPTLVLIEAMLGYFKLHGDGQNSWGYLIYAAFHNDFHPTFLWWAEVIPVVLIVLTVASFSFLGDALREILDPRTREGL